MANSIEQAVLKMLQCTCQNHLNMYTLMAQATIHGPHLLIRKVTALSKQATTFQAHCCDWRLRVSSLSVSFLCKQYVKNALWKFSLQFYTSLHLDLSELWLSRASCQGHCVFPKGKIYGKTFAQIFNEICTASKVMAFYSVSKRSASLWHHNDARKPSSGHYSTP